MNKLLGSMLVLLAALCLGIVVATIINLVLIFMRPETISVVNSLIGQSVLIICLLAAARVLSRAGLARFRTSRGGGLSSSQSPRSPQ